MKHDLPCRCRHWTAFTKAAPLFILAALIIPAYLVSQTLDDVPYTTPTHTPEDPFAIDLARTNAVKVATLETNLTTLGSNLTTLGVNMGALETNLTTLAAAGTVYEVGFLRATNNGTAWIILPPEKTGDE